MRGGYNWYSVFNYATAEDALKALEEAKQSSLLIGTSVRINPKHPSEVIAMGLGYVVVNRVRDVLGIVSINPGQAKIPKGFIR